MNSAAILATLLYYLQFPAATLAWHSLSNSPDFGRFFPMCRSLSYFEVGQL